jgi:hypothetical protein
LTQPNDHQDEKTKKNSIKNHHQCESVAPWFERRNFLTLGQKSFKPSAFRQFIIHICAVVTYAKSPVVVPDSVQAKFPCNGGFGRPSDYKLYSGLYFTRGLESKLQLHQTCDTSLFCHRNFVSYYSTQRILAEN